MLAVVVVAGSTAAVLAQIRPADIRGHWAEERILDLITRGIVVVSADGAFQPDDAITRGQFVAWLVAARGLPGVRYDSAFTDIGGHDFASAIETAAAYGVIPAGGAFRPNQPITRGDAVVFTVRGLGYTFEAAYMTNAPLPYRDADGLPPSLRGPLAVAALTAPPLLAEPQQDRARLFDPLSRAEAASLVWSYLQGVEGGVALAFTVSLGNGVTLVLEKRGALRVPPVWRVQIGAFQEEERARRLADAMRARGLPVVVDLHDDTWKVRVGNFATRDEAVAMQRRLTSEGLVTWTILTVRDYEALGGPFWTGALILEPAGGARLRPALARDAGVGRARTSDAARRMGALAAINGGFFSWGGDPLGCLMIDGEVVSEPLAGRTCAGLTDDGQILFDTMRFDGAAGTDTGTVALAGVNRERGPDEIILYRPSFGPATRTNNWGAEALVAGDVVQSVIDGRGNAPIPSGGYVLSGHGRARSLVLNAFKPGERVSLRARLVPTSGDPRWEAVRHVLGGGPRLLAEGRYVGGEGFRASFADRRHPRTALGRLADGRIVLMVVGGRQPYHSLGMTLPELARLMRRLGVTDALNLDGGGSSTLVVRGAVVNLPSDESGERPVSDVLLVMPPANGQ